MHFLGTRNVNGGRQGTRGRRRVSYADAMRYPARLALALVLFAAGLLVPMRARAAMMPHYDMVSLALEADAIVRGRVVSERRQDPWTTFKKIEIIRAYKGPLRVGDHIELSYDLYSMRPPFEGAGAADAGRPELGPDIVFFLETGRHGRAFMVGGPPVWQPHGRLAGDGGNMDPTSIAWSIVPSGMRTFLGGKAQRFVQWGNPGGYGPLPQEAEDGDPQRGLDLRGLERAMEQAMTRSSAIEAALEAPDSPARRDRLVELATTAGDREGAFYDNRAGTHIVETLAQQVDLPRTLLAVSRAAGASVHRAASPFAATALFDAAADTKSPLPVRLAAIELLRAQWSELRNEKDAERRIIALMGDAVPEIRAAMLDVYPTEKATTAMRAAIVRRFQAEPEEGVRIALFHAARSREMLAELPRGKGPMITARRTRDRVTIAWADLDDRANWMVADSSRITVTVAGEKTTLPLFGPETSYSNGASGDLRTRQVRPGFAAGGTVALRLDLEEVNTKRMVSRQFALGTVTIDQPAYGAPSPGAEPAPRGPEEAADAARVAGRPDQRRCGCATEGDGAGSLAAIIPLIALVYLARRRATVP